MFLIYISLILCINSQKFYSCFTESKCYGETITCDPEQDCTVQCSGKEACRDATIICPPDHTCDVQCYTATNIELTTNELTCYRLIVNASQSTQLLFTADLGDTGEALPYPRTFEDGTIHCPHNGRDGPTGPTIKPCQINCNGDSLMRRPKIYAVEGFNDLSITSTFYNLDFCIRAANVYCKPDFSASCPMTNKSPFECQDILHFDDDFTCQEYTITTDAPTRYNGIPTVPTAPTVMYPTKPPTKNVTAVPIHEGDNDTSSGLSTTQLILAILLPLLAVACVCMGFGIYVIKRKSDSKGQHQSIQNKDDSDNEALHDGTGEALPTYKQANNGKNNTESYSSDDSKSDSGNSGSGNETSTNTKSIHNDENEQHIDMGQPKVNDGDTGIHDKDNDNVKNGARHKVHDDAYSDEEY